MTDLRSFLGTMSETILHYKRDARLHLSCSSISCILTGGEAYIGQDTSNKSCNSVFLGFRVQVTSLGHMRVVTPWIPYPAYSRLMSPRDDFCGIHSYLAMTHEATGRGPSQHGE